MKKLICLFLAMAMLLFSASALAEAAEAPAETLFTPGTYTAEEQGIFAPVKVQITVSENLITGVKIDVKVICSDQHQVFGRFSGTAVLDDGTKIRISRLTGFAEKVRNKW